METDRKFIFVLVESCGSYDCRQEWDVVASHDYDLLDRISIEHNRSQLRKTGEDRTYQGVIEIEISDSEDEIAKIALKKRKER